MVSRRHEWDDGGDMVHVRYIEGLRVIPLPAAALALLGQLLSLPDRPNWTSPRLPVELATKSANSISKPRFSAALTIGPSDGAAHATVCTNDRTLRSNGPRLRRLMQQAATGNMPCRLAVRRPCALRIDGRWHFDITFDRDGAAVRKPASKQKTISRCFFRNPPRLTLEGYRRRVVV